MQRGRRNVAAALRAAHGDPAAMSDAHALALLAADGSDLEALARLCGRATADAVRETVSYVVNRNLNFTHWRGYCCTGWFRTSRARRLWSAASKFYVAGATMSAAP